MPDPATLRQRFEAPNAAIPAVTVVLPAADAYDTLLTGGEGGA